jgi:hypothetical protein
MSFVLVAQCSDGFFEMPDRGCYYVPIGLQISSSFSAASAICKSLDSQLVSIHSHQVQNFLQQLTANIFTMRHKKLLEESHY